MVCPFIDIGYGGFMPEQPRRILFITSFHPGASGYIGAGEAISAKTVQRLRAQSDQIDVLCIAPSYQRKNAQADSWCDSYTEVATPLWSTLLGLVLHCLKGAFIAPWFFTRTSPVALQTMRALIRDKKPTEVWIDFPSSLGFVHHIDGLPINYFVYDVVSQKVSRSPMKRLVYPWVRRIEATLLGRVRDCYLLSEKDRVWLADLGFTGKTDVWGVQGTTVGEVDNARAIVDVVAEFAQGPNLVFFGNMGRPENSRSVIHFALLKLWRIRRAFPHAVLWVIGLGPGPALRLLSRVVPGLRVVGPVDDPAPAFKAASLCVAPLLFGAGVKIKVLQMLEADATVMATEVGAEGIAANERLIIVDNQDMAPRIIDYLRRLKTDTDAASRAVESTSANN